MKVSVIIAVKEYNPFLKECLDKCLSLAYPDYEIIVLPDREFAYPDKKVRVIQTGVCLPAKKRDIGSTFATGEILAFLDDDAYPSENWLAAAVKNFSDPDVAAVGGPAVTPPLESMLSRASGLVYESYLVSGHFRYRYTKGKRQYVDDYPSCNLLVRKDVFEDLGGFKTNYWPGEDTVLCLEITRRLKKKIVYDPDVYVFHHRRPLYVPHLRQIKNYALHRGYFVKRFPETSLKWQYFVPSLFMLWVISGFFFFFLSAALFYPWFISICMYAVAVFLVSFEKKEQRASRLVSIGIFLTHLTYGLFFLLGLVSPALIEEGGK